MTPLESKVGTLGIVNFSLMPGHSGVASPQSPNKMHSLELAVGSLSGASAVLEIVVPPASDLTSLF